MKLDKVKSKIANLKMDAGSLRVLTDLLSIEREEEDKRRCYQIFNLILRMCNIEQEIKDIRFQYYLNTGSFPD